MNSNNKYLIVIAGPTAVGKTALAIYLAQHFNTSIISADSRQIYKELNIGVARPSTDELNAATHFCIAHKSIHEKYTAGNFEREVNQILEEQFNQKNIVILCGGTGLYINSVLYGFDDIPTVDENIRNDLHQSFTKNGIEFLQNKLQKLDIDSYNTIDIQNHQRVIRALEVCIGTGKPFSSFKQKKEKSLNFIPIKILLEEDRTILYNNINLRVDKMLEQGLKAEVEKVYPFKHLSALKTVGYQEWFDFFDGKIDETTAIEKIKQHTRNFAKRQITWFKKDTSFKTFAPSQKEKIIEYINEHLS
ncbi:MAG: tRNA (adenosine(37)-N6)-dimethylallyltransferase MiaA [Chitinophagales bacterium]|nr:tRNA (adenosine(37)-N6)-dimethylallyltransferase MiaA [Chitinophagales bacterium]